MSVSNIGIYFSDTAKYYLGAIWPNIKVSMYHDRRVYGTIFEITLNNTNRALIGREIIDLQRVTMEEFDYLLRKFFANFYYQARTSIVLKSMEDNNLKCLTQGVKHDILPQVEKGN